ncbi:6-pyruvoyl trahydropterin synthase family protein [Caulobacter sp. RL271]|uniref:6-carboxy-5,6,7,8-tetrahydropterin synthase n=1 Tax=Caulobacter segnis TaxID=88688 RepID=A0ABY4ZQF2_9CAUL|nr:6-carboxytetrahydropterin synthase [Caulobacter segnis]USQ94454.1 6-carboxytetrahydropterin synthase [Caulobacter segnis]
MAYRSIKTYGPERGLTCAYRQWAASSHCALLHGYSLGFTFTFAAEQLDARGWVVDFGAGGFGKIRTWLHEMFDHTLLVAQDDPALIEFQRLADLGLAQVRLTPSVSCEGLAAFVFDHAQLIIEAATQGRCWVESVTCHEHGANSAAFENPRAVVRKIGAEVMTEIIGRL